MRFYLIKHLVKSKRNYMFEYGQYKKKQYPLRIEEGLFCESLKKAKKEGRSFNKHVERLLSKDLEIKKPSSTGE